MLLRAYPAHWVWMQLSNVGLWLFTQSTTLSETDSMNTTAGTQALLRLIQMAEQAVTNVSKAEHSGNVSVPKGQSVLVPARHEVVIEGYAELEGQTGCHGIIEALPEDQNNLPKDILVARSLSSVNHNRVHTRLMNIWLRGILLRKGTVLAQVHKVEVIHSQIHRVKLLQVNQQRV